MNLRLPLYAALLLSVFCLDNKTFAQQVRKPAQTNPATTPAKTGAAQSAAPAPAKTGTAQTSAAAPAAPAKPGTAQTTVTNSAKPATTSGSVQRPAPTTTQATGANQKPVGTQAPGTRPAPAAGATRAGSPAQRVKSKVTKIGSPGSFYYVSGSYFSFADVIFAKVSGQKTHARAVFTGYTLGSDYTRYVGRFIYSWNLNILTGVVDIQRVLGVTYPRLSFFGAQSGPEIGYRVNSDLDLTYGLNLLYRDIEKVGPSFALDNQLNIKFRFSPRLTFFQSLGNYGKPTSYSYGIGLRWLL